MEQYFTVAELASLIHKGLSTCYRWLEHGIIRGVRVGNRWLISETEIQRILNGGVRFGVDL